MADKLGLIDPDTGAAAPVKAAGYALAVQENVIDQQTALGLNSAAFEPVSAFADAATASIARAAVTWQNIADLKLLHADAQGELDPVGGANLRTLPPPYATLLTAALPIVNSTAPTVIASITPPTGVAPTVGEAVTILCVGSYFNTTAAGATSQFTLSIALGGTVVFQDDVSNINAHASQRPMIIELQLIRAGAATAVLYGQAIVSVGGPAAVGFGDQSTLISRGNPLVAPVIQGSLLTYDWSNPPAITITLALGTAHAEHQYNRGFVRAYADRLHVIEATPTRAVLSRDTTRAIEGSASLRAVITADARQTNDAAFILGPSVTLTAGRQYTLSLAVYAEREGLLFPRFGSQISGGLFCGPGWNKLLWTFTSTASETVQLRLDVGAMFTSTINMDRIMLFAANADVFRRDFAKAVVVVNATPTSRTIALGGTFQRIAGTQDDVNNGAVLTEVIVPAYDAAILVRPQS